MTHVPPDFAAEALKAFHEADHAHLMLQSLEVSGLSFESAGKALVEGYLAEMTQLKSADRVLLFTGHMIDAPNRAEPRFPPAAESLAAKAIVEVIHSEQRQGEVTGIAGAAKGGDILFLEACRHNGIPFKMLLPFPPEQFIPESVAAPAGNWVERFRSLALDAQPAVLGPWEGLPKWLSEKHDYSIWARNNRWMISAALALTPRHFTLAALWDGKKGDGVGGTEDMVKVGQEHGAQFIHLDTRVLFKNAPAIRTAER